MCRTALLGLLLTCALPTAALCFGSGLVINELFADGSSNYPDWVELHNGGAEPVSLRGYRLSDNPDEPGWTVDEPFTLAPGEFKVFICDGKGVFDHTSFRLKSLSGELLLYDPAGREIDRVAYRNLPRYTSLGRYPDGGPDWYHHDAPTMGEPNSHGRIATTGADSDLPLAQLSHPSGRYDAPFVLTSPAQAGRSVRYTLDGSLPDGQSRILPASGLRIAETTVLRASVCGTGSGCGEVVTRSYLFHENSALPLVSVVTDPRNLWDPATGIYVDGETVDGTPDNQPNWRRNWRRPAHFDVLDTDGAWAVETTVRIAGNSSRQRPQKSLAVYAGDDEEPYGIRRRLFPDRPYDRYAGFLVRNGGDAWMRTQLRDAFQHRLIQDRSRVECQASRPALVFLNGEYWGFYYLRESHIKRNLLAKRGLPVQPVDLLGRGEISADDGPFAGFGTVTPDSDYRAQLPELDIDSFLDYLVIELFAGNRNWPSGNIECWRPRELPGAKWRWIVYDLDRGFDGVRGQAPTDDPFPILLRKPGRIGLHFAELIRNERFVRDFCARMTVHALTTFDPERSLAVLESMAEEIRPEMERHWNRWRWTWQPEWLFMNMDTWNDQLETLRRFCRERPANILRLLDERFGVGGAVQTDIAIERIGEGRIEVESVPLPDGVLRGPVPSGLTLTLRAVPAPGYAFAGWRDTPDREAPTLTVLPGQSVRDCAVFTPTN